MKFSATYVIAWIWLLRRVTLPSCFTSVHLIPQLKLNLIQKARDIAGNCLPQHRKVLSKKKSLQTYFILYGQKGYFDILYIKSIPLSIPLLLWCTNIQPGVLDKYSDIYWVKWSKFRLFKNHDFKDGFVTTGDQSLRVKLQVSGSSCHMDGGEKKMLWGLTGQTSKSWRIRRRERQQRKWRTLLQGTGDTFTFCPRLSVHPFFLLLGSAKRVKKKNTSVERDTPRNSLRLWCCHSAHSEAGHRGRLSAWAEAVCGNNPSPPPWGLFFKFDSNGSTTVLLKPSITHENLSALSLTEGRRRKKKSIFGDIQTGYTEPKAQPHRLAQQETPSRGLAAAALPRKVNTSS